MFINLIERCITSQSLFCNSLVRRVILTSRPALSRLVAFMKKPDATIICRNADESLQVQKRQFARRRDAKEKQQSLVEEVERQLKALQDEHAQQLYVRLCLRTYSSGFLIDSLMPAWDLASGRSFAVSS